MSKPGPEEDELKPSDAGYQITAKKSVQEYANLDAEDESLRKWKESLGIKGDAAPAGPKDDPRKVVVLSLALEVPGRQDVVMDVSSPAAIAKLQASKPIVIKEGATYQLKLRFKIQHEIVTGLKYLHVVKRLGVAVDKAEEMVGSYGPQEAAYEKKFPAEEAPSGMMARGTYDVRSAFIDDDKVRHLEWAWKMEIKKDWS
ncbi:immunoglobulin E-set [Hyaloraphidium curvatum]|nr:immunoglobulin E-set [Hyaloraphidium curvatum]